MPKCTEERIFSVIIICLLSSLFLMNILEHHVFFAKLQIFPSQSTINTTTTSTTSTTAAAATAATTTEDQLDSSEPTIYERAAARFIAQMGNRPFQPCQDFHAYAVSDYTSVHANNTYEHTGSYDDFMHHLNSKYASGDWVDMVLLRINKACYVDSLKNGTKPAGKKKFPKVRKWQTITVFKNTIPLWTWSLESDSVNPKRAVHKLALHLRFVEDLELGFRGFRRILLQRKIMDPGNNYKVDYDMWASDVNNANARNTISKTISSKDIHTLSSFLKTLGQEPDVVINLLELQRNPNFTWPWNKLKKIERGHISAFLTAAETTPDLTKTSIVLKSPLALHRFQQRLPKLNVIWDQLKTWEMDVAKNRPKTFHKRGFYELSPKQRNRYDDCLSMYFKIEIKSATSSEYLHM